MLCKGHVMLVLVPLAWVIQLASGDNAAMMFPRPFNEVDACANADAVCKKCYDSCPVLRQSFFNEHGPINTAAPYVSYPTEVKECRVGINVARAGLLPWCINDEQRFYATDEFVATPANCEILRASPALCAAELHAEYAARVAKGLMDGKKLPFQNAKRMDEELGPAFKTMHESKAAYEKEKSKYAQLKEMYEQEKKGIPVDLRSMPAFANLPNPADPVFTTMERRNGELRRLTSLFNQNNVSKHWDSTVGVRKWTSRVIRQNINYMKGLTHGVFKRTTEANSYVKDIRHLINEIYHSQVLATNFEFESSRSVGLTGELDSLDEDFLDTMDHLRKQRYLLRREMTAAMNEKYNLVQSVRSMIETISAVQRADNCPPDQYIK